MGAEHPDTASSLDNLAYMFVKQGRYAEAEPLCLRALAITEKVLGGEHPDAAYPLKNLGKIYKDTGDYQKVEAMLLRALEMWQPTLGLNHSHAIEALTEIIDLYTKMELPDKAAHYQAILPEKDTSPS